MSDPANEPRVFGFTRGEWVRSGAFTDAEFDQLLASLARGERTVVAASGWMQLARLGPEYARAVWERFGPGWTEFLRRIEEGNARPESAIRTRARLSERIRELRELAGLDRSA